MWANRVAVVFVALATIILVSGCQDTPYASCRIKKLHNENLLDTDAKVELSWCKEETETRIVTVEGCPAETVRKAASFWKPFFNNVEFVESSQKSNFHFRLGEPKIKDGRWANTTRKWVGKHTLVSVEIVSKGCELNVIAHEIGHGLGFGHSPDKLNVMHPTVNEDSNKVTETELNAMVQTVLKSDNNNDSGLDIEMNPEMEESMQEETILD